MSPTFVAVFWAVGVLFTAAALLSVYRIVRGPSILDRMIASDVLLTTLILVVGAEMVYNGHTRTIPLMLVIAATAVFATIAVARYVSKQDLATRPEITDAEVSDSPVSDADLADADLAVSADGAPSSAGGAGGDASSSRGDGRGDARGDGRGDG